MENTNIVLITAYLTRDPELRGTKGGGSVAELRVAVNGSRKEGEEWVDKPNFFNVVAFGKTAENVTKYRRKGDPILVEGRLDWSEWETEEGARRQGVKIIAVKIVYLPRSTKAEGSEEEDNSQSEIPEVEPAAVGAEDSGDLES